MTEPMTDDIRARHPDGPHQCPHWSTSDPNDTRCDAIRMADERDEWGWPVRRPSA